MVNRMTIPRLCAVFWVAAGAPCGHSHDHLFTGFSPHKLTNVVALASLPPPAWAGLMPRSTLGRYELLRLVAEGGMAQVWLATARGDDGGEELVAIKTVLPKYAGDASFQRMLLDEGRIAARIDHPNVARIVGIGEHRGAPYMAMEWVEGDALAHLQRALEKKQSTIHVGVLLRILADACAGLHAAHELRGAGGALLGVVHRDVSPQNVLVSRHGVTKVVDFGLAQMCSRLSGESQIGILKGKIEYMAPEQAMGGPVDRRADVWAVGAMMHHCLSGAPPYGGGGRLQTINALVAGREPMPLPATVPAPVAAIVDRALARDPSNRYATAASMRDALERAMIDVGAPTTTAGVAAYLDAHLGERAAKRRKAIDAALIAAREATC